MQRSIGMLAVAVVVAVVAGTSLAYAQEEAVSEVPFAFRVGEKSFQPGKYTFRTDDIRMIVTISDAAGTEAVAIAETRLAAPESPLAEGKLVFDKVGETYYLSELWTPGDDGFLLHSTRERHSHAVVRMVHRKRT